jgi:hypothetical protein
MQTKVQIPKQAFKIRYEAFYRGSNDWRESEVTPKETILGLRYYISQDGKKDAEMRPSVLQNYFDNGTYFIIEN